MIMNGTVLGSRFCSRILTPHPLQSGFWPESLEFSQMYHTAHPTFFLVLKIGNGSTPVSDCVGGWGHKVMEWRKWGTPPRGHARDNASWVKVGQGGS